jgi:ATP-dependent helicase HrpB
LLAEKVFESGIERFVDGAELEELLARSEFAAQHSNLKALDEADVRASFETLIAGLCTFAQVREVAAQLVGALEQSLDRRMLEEVAPAKIRLPSGRQARIHYERGKTPWVASRLQDFFGLRESPRIARGKVPLVAHLLAPNQRAVQTTSDLAGFWERLYPQVRRELGRRYPRHSWPERPY